jgi:hypothetical protein
MLCSHSPLRRSEPEPHIRDNPQSHQVHRDPHPRLNQGTRFAGLYLVDVSSASAPSVSSRHVITERSGPGIAHGDHVLIAA